MEESETLYISPSAQYKWDYFKSEANKRHMTLSKYAYHCMVNDIRKVNIGTFFDGVEIVLIAFIFMKVLFL